MWPLQQVADSVMDDKPAPPKSTKQRPLPLQTTSGPRPLYQPHLPEVSTADLHRPLQFPNPHRPLKFPNPRRPLRFPSPRRLLEASSANLCRPRQPPRFPQLSLRLQLLSLDLWLPHYKLRFEKVAQYLYYYDLY